MYCDKPSVNLLTALLLPYGIGDVVVCPGSRNGALVHNFNELSRDSRKTSSESVPFHVHAVTDERSAAFFAVGLILARRSPVAVCVTSGSALLNTLPAVAEAAARALPLLVISADRPPQWIGQLDGQTLPQPHSLLPYARTWILSEPGNKEEEYVCARNIQEAFHVLTGRHHRPVHLNVPLSEPLFSFHTAELPRVSRIEQAEGIAGNTVCPKLETWIGQARLPLVVIGQCDDAEPIRHALETIDAGNRMLVLPEIVSQIPGFWRNALIEERPEILAGLNPDVVLHIGGNMVGKQVKAVLRKSGGCRVVRVEETDAMPDTFLHLSMMVRAETATVLRRLADVLPENLAVKEARAQLSFLREQRIQAADDTFTPRERFVLALSEYMKKNSVPLAAFHVANSSSIRLVAKVFGETDFPLYCNRGLNGIEGSLSVAVGCATATQDINLMLIGDLSFFYDVNALWNVNLPRNLRIVMLNDGGGHIFSALPGLSGSPARDRYIAGGHSCEARHIAAAFHLEYQKSSLGGYDESLFRNFFDSEKDSPVLWEVDCRE